MNSVSFTFEVIITMELNAMFVPPADLMLESLHDVADCCPIMIRLPYNDARGCRSHSKATCHIYFKAVVQFGQLDTKRLESLNLRINECRTCADWSKTIYGTTAKGQPNRSMTASMRVMTKSGGTLLGYVANAVK